jgi:hypothetical protein
MYPPKWLLGNGSVNTFRGKEYTRNKRRILVRVVFYAVRVVPKENGRLVLSRVPYNWVGQQSTVMGPLLVLYRSAGTRSGCCI